MRPALLLFVLAMMANAAAGRPRIEAVSASANTVGRFEMFELTARVDAAFENPFDPEQVEVAGEFTGRSGKVLRVPGFFYQGFTRRLEHAPDGKSWEVNEKSGEACWKVRFAPPEVGRYRAVLTVRDREGEARSKPVAFECVPSRNPGFVRVSKSAPRFFEFDSGKPYFAIGENLCWPGPRGTFDYDDWLPALRRNGANYGRLWVGPFQCFTLERPRDHPGGPWSLGHYDLESAWRLDYVVEQARENGVYLLMCLESFNSLRASEPYPFWQHCPYNAATGGPCAKPEDFFTNAAARRLFKQRLGYAAARWGYATNVLAWEFWNEVDIIEKYVSPQVRDWHREMARHLRGVDAFGHMMTTSFAISGGDPAVDGLPEMDYVQTHCYGARDIAGALLAWSQDKQARYRKPHVVGEFGADGTGKNDMSDEQGIHLHNGIWAMALCGDAGTAMTWWWDQYVAPRNLYHHYAALARFMRGVDLVRAGYGPARVEGISFAPGARAQWSDLTLDPGAEFWRKHPANEPREYVVRREGAVGKAEMLSKVLHGVVNHKDKHNPPTFVVDYPADGAFEVIVNGVSGWGGAKLRIRLDGKTLLSAEFPDNPAAGHDTLHKYDGAYRIDVPAGKHRLMVENEGADWAYVSYRFVRYLTAPDVRVAGLANADSALLWLQNKANTWWNALQKIEVQPVAPVRITLGGLRDGEYVVEWWDSYKGAVVSRESARARGGRLTLATPAIARDIACKIRRR